MLLRVPSRPLGAASAAGNSRALATGSASGVRRGFERVFRFDTARAVAGMRADASGGPERPETDPDVAGNCSSSFGSRGRRKGEVEPLGEGNTARGSDLTF